MQLAIDAREAFKETRTGKGIWAYFCIQELLKRGLSLVLLTDAPPCERLLDAYGSHRGTFEIVLIEKSGLQWHLSAAKYIREHRDIDVFLATTSYIIPILAGHHRPIVTCVHDTIAFQRGAHDLKAKIIERATLRFGVQQSTAVCTLSETTKHDLLRLVPTLDPTSILTVFSGPTLPPDKSPSQRDGSILCVGTLCPRKNQERLLLAYRLLPAPLRDAHPLVIVGKRGWKDHEIVALIRSTPGVTWHGYVTDLECQALIRNASVLAFPSLYEGFGIPILDAFAAHTPLLTSDCGSMREVAGDAAVLVDPLSTASIADGLTRLLTDASLREQCVERGIERLTQFSWKATGDRLMEVIAQAVARRRKR